MVTLREFASSYKSAKDLTDLQEIPVNIEIKEGSFEKNGSKLKYHFIEIDNWKYSLKGDIIQQIQQVISNRPTTTKIKVNRAPNGALYVVPLD